MDVLCTEVELHLPESRSLKQKRSIVKGLKQRMKDRFGVSVAEIGYHDLWQRTLLGFALVSSDAKRSQSIMQKIQSYLESDPRLMLVRFEEEWR